MRLFFPVSDKTIYFAVKFYSTVESEEIRTLKKIQREKESLDTES